MVSLLAHIFIKNPDDMDKNKIRIIYGILCGAVGIGFNIILFTGKLIVGTISNSIAITADAFNNLSDAGSSIVTLIGFRLSGSKPDPEHPFGHGRIEYLSGLIVSGVILIMAFELVKSSIAKIIHPDVTTFNILTAVILLVSIAVKLYMAYYNYRIGKKIDSAAIRATCLDSLSDTAATTVVLIASIISALTHIQIDGYCGVIVGLFIFYAGINAAKDTLNPLLGQMPDEEFVDNIDEIVMSHKMVQGIHDLVVHDYGPGRQMISLHVEVPADQDIILIHDTIDNIEDELQLKLGCEAVIHMDPVVNDEKTLLVKQTVKQILFNIDSELTMHDFRMVPGETHTNLIFDIVASHGNELSDDELKDRISTDIKEVLGITYFAVIKVDKAYVK